MKQKSTMTREEAADQLGLSIRTIDRMVAKGILPALKHKRAVRISTEGFLRYMASHKAEKVTAVVGTQLPA